MTPEQRYEILDKLVAMIFMGVLVFVVVIIWSHY
jgi:hypothetical protein